MTIENNIVPIDFAKMSKLIIKDVTESTNTSTMMKKYKKEHISNFLNSPAKFEKQLRELSNFLYNVSPNYKRLILYLATMLTFDHFIEPSLKNKGKKINKKKFKDDYDKVAYILDNMEIKHEFSKILVSVFKEDVFYGYEHETEDSYFIQKLDPEFCRLFSVEDGVFTFQFDFTYFDKKANSYKLRAYPNEFQVKYRAYENDKKNKRWQELSSKKTICIKANEDLDYIVPPMSNVFEALFDIDDYKNLKKTKTKLDNYMILTHKIPMDESKGEVNKFLIDGTSVQAFHNNAANSLPDEVALITTPMEIEAIRLEKKNSDQDNVAAAERDYFNAAGVSQLLFNSEKSISSGLSKSIITDEQLPLRVLKQLNRWVNKKIKSLDLTYNFKVKFLEVTAFNQDEVFNRSLKAAQYGAPNKLELMATLGYSPSAVEGMLFLENDILELHDKLKPLSSSHTQSGKDKQAGAPKKNENDLSEDGAKTRELDGNVRT